MCHKTAGACAACVRAQWEAASIPEAEVAQIVGHEKRGITFGVYGGGVSLQRRYEIVAKLAYPEVTGAAGH